MNRFTNYLLKLFLKNILIISLFIIIIQYLSSAYGNLGLLEGYKYSIIDFIILTSYGITLGINQLVPIIVAVAVLLTIIMLMKNNEMLAYMTIGGSIFRLAFPMLFIGFILASLMMYSEYKIIPGARDLRENKLDTMKNRPIRKSNTYHNMWFVSRDNNITHIDLISPGEKTIFNVQEYILNNDNRLTQINKIEKVIKENEVWTAYNIQTIFLNQNPPITEIKEKEISNDETWDKLTNIKSLDIRGYNPKELYTLMQLYKEKGINSSNVEIALYFKIASAISVIILILVLYPMSINFSRNYSIVKNASMTFSIFIVFILVQQSFLSLGKNGLFSPAVAVFFPIILFFIIGLMIIFYKNRPQ